MRDIAGNALGDKAGSGGDAVADHIQDRIDRGIKLEGKKRPFTPSQERCSGAGLAFGQGIHKVVDHDTGYVDVSPHCVGEVSRPDAKEVTVAANDHNCELGISQLGSLRDKNSTTVKAVKSVGVYIGGYPRRTADSGDDESLMPWYPQTGQGCLGQPVEERKTARMARCAKNLRICATAWALPV